jgi:O-acetylhomoserine/O-acetylserine sulfhydrylase-like pyridoxal-dependent enzyme
VHGGEPRLNLASALTAPIVQTATYAFRDSPEIADHFEGRVERNEYGRYGNPTQRVAERKLAVPGGRRTPPLLERHGGHHHPSSPCCRRGLTSS